MTMNYIGVIQLQLVVLLVFETQEFIQTKQMPAQINQRTRKSKMWILNMLTDLKARRRSCK